LWNFNVLAGEVSGDDQTRRYGFSTAQPLVRYIDWDEIVRAMFVMENDEMWHLQGGPL